MKSSVSNLTQNSNCPELGQDYQAKENNNKDTMLNFDTLAYVNWLTTQLQTIHLNKVKDFLIDELHKEIPHSSIVWATRKDVSSAINMEKIFTRGYQKEQIVEYAKFRDQDKLLNHCIANPGKAFLLADAFDLDDPVEVASIAAYSNAYAISDCLCLVTGTDGSSFQHVVSLHLNHSETSFLPEDKNKLEILIPLYAYLLDSRLNQVKHNNWVLDSNKAMLGGEQPQKIEQLLLNRQWQDAGDFYLVAKDDFRPQWEKLSNSEKEVVKCLMLGLSNKQVANELDKSESTVAKQLTSIYAKLGVRSRTGLLSVLNG